LGWLFMASVGTGAALWASTFISILALDPSLNSGFEPGAIAAVLTVAIIACLAGFEIGSRHFTLAPEAGGLVVGVGILAMHLIGFEGWHIAGTVEWNAYGIAATFVLGLSLSALAVNRANRPVTRWCRHGAAIVLAFMIFVTHYAMTASTSAVADPLVTLPSYLVPAHVLGLAVVAVVALVMGSGFSTYIIDLRSRTESADRIHQLSFNDTMTGLPNRIAFNERLAFDAADAHEKAHKLAAFSIDLNGFKDVNDTFGHSAGDRLLIEVADRMRRLLGPGKFLARQGGDEFLGLQMSGNHPQDAQAFAERVVAVFADPFQIHDQVVNLTAAIGYSIAKLAMYRGKTKQRGIRSVVTSARWMTRHARNVHWPATCKALPLAVNWNCTINCRRRSRTGGSTAPKR
jgi:diguanylate cyclase